MELLEEILRERVKLIGSDSFLVFVEIYFRSERSTRNDNGESRITKANIEKWLLVNFFLSASRINVIF